MLPSKMLSLLANPEQQWWEPNQQPLTKRHFSLD